MVAGEGGSPLLLIPLFPFSCLGTCRLLLVARNPATMNVSANAQTAAAFVGCASSVLYDAGNTLECHDLRCRAQAQGCNIPTPAYLYWCRMCGATYCGTFFWEHYNACKGAPQ